MSELRFVNRAARLISLAGLADIEEKRVELDEAIEALRLASLDAAGTPGPYLLSLAAYLDLVLTGDADVLAPEIREEIELLSFTTKLEACEVSLLVTGYAALLVDVEYPSRREAVSARAVLSAMADALAESFGDLLGYLVLEEFLEIVGSVALQLTAIAANQVPLIEVETGVSIPSTLAAWKLYGDPSRAAEITKRNGVGTPVYLPEKFEALSS